MPRVLVSPRTLALCLLAAALIGACAKSSHVTAPSPDPAPPAKIAGRSYAMTRLADQSAPFQIKDYTAPDGARQAYWIVSDSLRFGTDGRFTYLTTYRWLDQDPGMPEDVYEDMGSGGGWFIQIDDRFAIAWNWISEPPHSAYRDTLRIVADSLVRRWTIPAPCPSCPSGTEVDRVYAPAGE